MRGSSNVELNHVFPFLWMHGESHETLAEEIEKIAVCGIKSFCAESRTHEKFCQEQWWKDFGFVLEEAKKRDMRVWLLDDKHYPTGFANGAIERHPELAAQQVMCTQMDVCGKENGAKIILTEMGVEEQLLGAFAFPAIGEKFEYAAGLELTEQVKNNILFWDVPEGVWRVMAVFTSHRCAAWNFIDMLNPASADLMISEIYQPHYEHFKEYFGNTFIGFFSDEPRFGNGPSNASVVMKSWTQRTLGIPGMSYPWSAWLEKDLLSSGSRMPLVSLWWDCGAACADFRVRYMNLITEAYAQNFSERLGGWCREHGVYYTGHIIEDNGAHTMTGCSAGHYFKSMRGQDMAGIDVVFNVLRPGFSHAPHLYRGFPLFADEKFYQFTLAKLASSAAHTEPRKAGRAMCELFGAYGWAEDVTEMKWLVDHMLSRGINYFVPHAFNPLVDDTDCPPYFYNGGRNPQFLGIGILMRYMEKMGTIFSGGEIYSDVAVLYHAEAEWSGLPYKKIDDICRLLTEKQVAFDIVTEDDVLNAKFSDGVMKVGRCRYRCLVVPPRAYFGQKLREKLKTAGETVYYCEGMDLPLRYVPQFRLETPARDMRILRYSKGEESIYFLFNEGMEQISGKLFVPEGGMCVLTDEMTGFSKTVPVTDGGVCFMLPGGESRVLRFSGNMPYCSYREIGTEKLFFEADISLCPAGDQQFTPLRKGSPLEDIAETNPKFAGKIRYRVDFESEKNRMENCRILLDLGKMSGAVFVSLNGEPLGERIASPYMFEVTDSLCKGKNELTITYSTTLALEKRDRASHFIAVPKYGLQDYPILRFFACENAPEEESCYEN